MSDRGTKPAIVRRGQQRHWHQEPLTAYERMLDRAGLDCCVYACWLPIRAVVAKDGRTHRYCECHAREFCREDEIKWLEG